METSLPTPICYLPGSMLIYQRVIHVIDEESAHISAIVRRWTCKKGHDWPNGAIGIPWRSGPSQLVESPNSKGCTKSTNDYDAKKIQKEGIQRKCFHRIWIAEKISWNSIGVPQTGTTAMSGRWHPEKPLICSECSGSIYYYYVIIIIIVYYY